MPQQDFAATVSAWVAKTQQRTEAVFKESAQRVFEVAQAGVPVDTGFAKSSFVVDLNAEPVQADRANPGGSFAYDPSVASLTIAEAKIGDRIVGSWGANYITYLEYGTSKMAARRFVGLAVQQWASIVKEVSGQAEISTYSPVNFQGG